MDTTIDKIMKSNTSFFGDNPKVEKINIGFTNTIYNVNDSYIVKVCTDLNNEDNFKKEIEFYNANKNNSLIPKLYYFSVDKNKNPYFYEIIEKVKGVSLYSVWHTYSEVERENIIKQLCDAMKQMHSHKTNSYDWCLYIKNEFNNNYDKVKSLFNDQESNVINNAFLEFDKYLEFNEFVLVHNDLHFDNIIVNDGKIKIIDFERSMYAPKDFELDIIYRMIRLPWKFASEETEKYTDINQYSHIMDYIKRYYPELVSVPYLYKRLAIYDMVYNMKQLIEYPHLKELKDNIINAAEAVMKDGEINGIN